MYDELVKALRICEDGEHCGLCPKWDDKQNGGMNVCLTAICKEAADAIEELSRENESLAKSVNEASEILRKRWIPVTERLPEEMDRSCGGWSAEIRPSDDVLVWLSHEKRQSVAWYSHTYNEWTTVDENTVYCFGEVTRWQSLPQPPKEEI